MIKLQRWLKIKTVKNCNNSNKNNSNNIKNDSKIVTNMKTLFKYMYLHAKKQTNQLTNSSIAQVSSWVQWRNFHHFMELLRFITSFTRARYLSQSWARSIESMPPHPTSRRSILILSFHVRVGLPSILLLSGFPSKTLYAALPIRAACSVHLSFFELIARTMHHIMHSPPAKKALHNLFSLRNVLKQEFRVVYFLVSVDGTCGFLSLCICMCLRV